MTKKFHLCSIALICMSMVLAKRGRTASDREEKLLSFFEIVRFSNDVCQGSQNRNGTCYTQSECDSRGGTASGACANGFGVCCIFSLACGATTSENNTVLAQSGVNGMQQCTYTICRSSPDICRIRLDFNTFSIASPLVGTALVGTASAPVTTGVAIGDCVTDSFSFSSPGSTGSPVICGSNTGQHMIVDASAACNMATFSIGGGTLMRDWEILVTQYACGDETGGPAGCLQYFVGDTGTVSSFNFPTTGTTVGASATHLSNQCYSICFRQEPNRCGICFSPRIDPGTGAAMQSSFGLSVSPAIASQSATDSLCTTDYIQISNGEPSPFTPGTVSPTRAQRLCGRIFSAQSGATTSVSVCTQTVPFRIAFKTDDVEVETGATGVNVNEQSAFPAGIVGFSLNYKQVAC